MMRNILCYLFYIRAKHGFFLHWITGSLIKLLLYADKSLINAWFATEERLTKHWYTPLSWSCKKNDVAMVSYLLGAGAQLQSECTNSKGENRLTELEVVVNSSNFTTLNCLFLQLSPEIRKDSVLRCVELLLKYDSKTPQEIFHRLSILFYMGSSDLCKNIAKHEKVVAIFLLIFSKISNEAVLERLSKQFYAIFDQMEREKVSALLKAASAFLPPDVFVYLYEKFDETISANELFVTTVKDPIMARGTKKIRYLLNEKNCKPTIDVLMTMIDRFNSIELVELLKLPECVPIQNIQLNEEFITKLFLKHDDIVLAFFLKQQPNILSGDSCKKTLFDLFTKKDVKNYAEKIKLLHEHGIYDIADLCSSRPYSLLPWIIKKANNNPISEEYLDLFNYITTQLKESLGQQDTSACLVTMLECLSKDAPLNLYEHFLLGFNIDLAKPELFFQFFSLFPHDTYIIDCKGKINLLLDKYCNCFANEANQEKLRIFLHDLFCSSRHSIHTACIALLIQKEPYKSIICTDCELLYSLLIKMDQHAISFFSEFFINTQFFYSDLVPLLAANCNIKQLFFLLKTINSKECADTNGVNSKKALFIKAFWKNFNINNLVRMLSENESNEIQEIFDFLQVIFNISDSSYLISLFNKPINCLDSNLCKARIAAVLDIALLQLKQRRDHRVDDIDQSYSSILGTQGSILSDQVGCLQEKLPSDFFYEGLLPYRHPILLNALLSLDDMTFNNVIIETGKLFDENFTKLAAQEINTFLSLMEGVWCSKSGYNKTLNAIKDYPTDKLHDTVNPAVMLGLMQYHKKHREKDCSLSLQKFLTSLTGHPKVIWKLVYFCLALGKGSLINQKFWDEVLKKDSFKYIIHPSALNAEKEYDPAYCFMHAITYCHDNVTLLNFIIKCKQKCKANNNSTLYQQMADFLVQDCLKKQNFVLLACLVLCSEECSNIMQELLKNPQKLKIDSNKVSMWVSSYLTYLLAGVQKRKISEQTNNNRDGNCNLGPVNISQDQDANVMAELIKILYEKVPAERLVKEGNFLYGLLSESNNTVLDESLIYYDNISIFASWFMTSLKAKNPVKISSQESVLNIEFSCNGGYKFSLPLHHFGLVVSRLSNECVNELLSNSKILGSLIAHGDKNLYNVLHNKAMQYAATNNALVNQDMLFCIWRQGGFRALDCFTTFVLGLCTNQSDGGIIPDFKAKNQKGENILCLYYKQHQKLVRDRHCSTEDKNNYARLMRNLCFFYTAEDIWDLALPLCNRISILWQFFSLSSSVSAVFHGVSIHFGLALPMSCKKKISTLESVTVGVDDDIENMHHTAHHNSSAFVDAAEENKNTVQVPSTETKDADASKIKILDNNKSMLTKQAAGG